MCEANPWSWPLFGDEENLDVDLRRGDACEIVTSLADEQFSAIIHDPPALALCKDTDLYSLSFYEQLRRVLKRGGKIFHYIGNPDSKESGRLYRGISSRLQDAGFGSVKTDKTAFGLRIFTLAFYGGDGLFLCFPSLPSAPEKLEVRGAVPTQRGKALTSLPSNPTKSYEAKKKNNHKPGACSVHSGLLPILREGPVGREIPIAEGDDLPQAYLSLNKSVANRSAVRLMLLLQAVQRRFHVPLSLHTRPEGNAIKVVVGDLSHAPAPLPQHAMLEVRVTQGPPEESQGGEKATSTTLRGRKQAQ
eukprot:scaffold1866_cov277-Pinguiococcus_pyrenoidosus.AAC.10